MRSLALISNPAAGRGRCRRELPAVRSALRDARLSYTELLTKEPGDAERLARAAREEFDVVVAVGGDGTIHEVVNGLYGGGAPLGIIPVGSGNDLIRMLGIKNSITDAVNVLKAGSIRRIDLGRVNGRLFTNSLAFGIDGAVAVTMQKAGWLPTWLAYHAGVLINVFTYRNRVITWEADGETGRLKAALASVMNGHTYGGGYKVAPPARIDDSKLDLVIFGDYGILGRIIHLPKMKRGKHMELDKLTYRQAEKIRLRCDDALPVAVDGELLPAGDSIDLKVDILPEALPVVAPALE